MITVTTLIIFLLGIGLESITVTILSIITNDYLIKNPPFKIVKLNYYFVII